MPYLTLAQLSEKPGASELAQVATAQHRKVVAPELMELTLLSGDRSGFDVEAIAVADDALARIIEIVAEVDQSIDSYIRRRVPTVPVVPAPAVLTRIARAFVRYELHKDVLSGDDPIVRDYKDKRSLLEAIRDGKVTLGEGDPVAATPDGSVHVSSRPRLFTRNSLRAL